MSFILTLLPIILKILALLFGGGAALSAQRLGASPDATLQHWLTFVGSYGGLAAASWGSGELTAWINRARASKVIDWPTIAAKVGNVNLPGLIRLIALVIQHCAKSPEIVKAFKDALGINLASMPSDENAIAQLALVHRRAN